MLDDHHHSKRRAVDTLNPDVPSVILARPDLEAVNELFGTMKLIVNILGSTVDTLGDHTVKLTELRSALDADCHVCLLSEQLNTQCQRQEERMQRFKDSLSEQFENGLRSHITEQVCVLTRELVRKEIADRVCHQLTVLLPDSLREKITLYRRRILSVRVSLHNSEARRLNGLICSAAPGEPLRALLRPLRPSILQEEMSPRPLFLNTSHHVSLSSIPDDDYRPTPSPLFPSNLTFLSQLGPDEMKTLMSDYGLHESHAEDKGLADCGLIAADERTSAVDMSRFMSYIGIAPHLIP
ncbi:hypothetical protein BKA93DRAFT_781083 [Sparassis latifolia]|uniref:Uncharacterized protein n=1 Tax=Sparassis crispa TaxID=139825 RepID=A0A401GFI3_9APHY|nr:predicted protein [Sparassis crispa]GBE80954.1 predicted protein [Sparassis crispa]